MPEGYIGADLTDYGRARSAARRLERGGETAAVDGAVVATRRPRRGGRAAGGRGRRRRRRRGGGPGGRGGGAAAVGQGGAGGAVADARSQARQASQAAPRTRGGLSRGQVKVQFGEYGLKALEVAG